jgi:hypothetical protein
MDLVKKHYEKFLLGLVLLGLVVAVAFLPFKIASDKQALEEKRASLIPKAVKPLTNLDLTLPENVLKRAATPPTPAEISYSAPNKLFNPMPWQQKPDGSLIPGTSVGATAATVTNITPLYLKLTLDNVVISDAGARYVIGIEKQAALVPTQRNKKQAYCKLNDKDKDNTFQLVEVKGKPEEPDQLVLQLTDTGERAVISKDQPFKRVDGYLADINYDPENKKWTKQRVNARLSFNFEDYNIVAISRNEVVLSAKSNGKKWTIKYSTMPNPEPR